MRVYSKMAKRLITIFCRRGVLVLRARGRRRIGICLGFLGMFFLSLVIGREGEGVMGC